MDYFYDKRTNLLDQKTYQKLVLDLQHQTPGSLKVLYENYSDALYGIILRIVKDEQLAEETLQSCFLKIWQNGSSYDPKKARLFTWMMRIARNLSLNAIESKTYRKTKHIQALENAVHISNGNGVGKEVTMDLHFHINALEPKYAEVIEMTFIKGYSHQDASEELGLPLGTLKSRIRTALKELRKVYEFKHVNAMILIFWILVNMR